VEQFRPPTQDVTCDLAEREAAVNISAALTILIWRTFSVDVWLLTLAYISIAVSRPGGCVVVYDDDGVLNPSKSISTCGYSFIAIVFASILGLLVCTSVVLTGRRKFKPGMPLVGSCSAAISAACHPPEEDRNASQKAVMWGACERETPGSSGEAVGHCSITSFQVQAPVAGNRYAGQRRHQHLSQE